MPLFVSNTINKLIVSDSFVSSVFIEKLFTGFITKIFFAAISARKIENCSQRKIWKPVRHNMTNYVTEK